MSPVEKNEKIFQAALGCTTAAVEFLRSVNKPINATFIAQNAWEIAKKLEEMMEVNIERDTATLTTGTTKDYRPQSSQNYTPIAAPVKNPNAAMQDDDLVALKDDGRL